MKTLAARSARAFTLTEVLIASAVGAVALGAVTTGAVSMQRCAAAAEDFAVAKSDQARLSDYLALDLRRALAVTAGSDGTTLLTVKIPDYYDATGSARTPTITNYVVNYGNATTPMTVVYRKTGSSIFRQENNSAAREIAQNVEDFQLTVQDLGKVVKTQVTFLPRFSRVASAANRTATTVYGTTLLRNTRKNL